MEITVSQDQGRVPVTVFRIKGDIDASSYEQLQARAERAVATGTQDLLIDLTDVGYVSSSGMRALSHVFNLLHAREGRDVISQGVRAGTYASPHLKLTGVRPSVWEVLRTTGVDMFIDMKPTYKEALAAF